MQRIIETGKWHNIEVCQHCEVKITFKETFSECCPYCGADPSSVYKNFMDTKKYFIRRLVITSSPWWMFWNYEYFYEGKDDDAKEWLTKFGYKQLPKG